MSREIPPYALRMPPDLRARLEHAAELNGRSLNSELCARLQSTIEEVAYQPAHVMREPIALDADLTQNERDMLTLFRRWSAAKQLGFLVLFQP